MDNKNLSSFEGNYAKECFDLLFEEDNKKSKKKQKKKKKKKKLKEEIILKAADTGFNTMSDIVKMYAYNKIFQNAYTAKSVKTEDSIDIGNISQIPDKLQKMK
jgi:hypothetical protein